METGLRKAAVLLSGLDKAIVKRILDAMPIADAKRIREEWSQLKSVSPAGRHAVLTEFLDENRKEYPSNETVSPAISTENEETTGPESFAFLNDRKPGEIFAILRNERNAVIVAVLHEIPSTNRLRILACFPVDRRKDIARGLAEQHHPDPLLMKSLENALMDKLING